MEFDPTFNYGDIDLTIEEDNIRWHFGELVKNLITLSSDAKVQVDIMGYGVVSEEMADDFDTYFTSRHPVYLASNLLSLAQIEKLKELELFFQDASADFWDDSLLNSNPEWKVVRQKAFDILILLGMQDLIIEFDREEQHVKSNDGQPLIIQGTKTRMVRRNDG